jgi:tetratricopeptide (TPR) repeat protein
LLRESVRELERLVGPESYEVRNPLKRLGETLLELQQPAEALALLERTRALELRLLGSAEHRDLASTEYLLARALSEPGPQQDPDAARRFAEHAVALSREHYPGLELGRALLLRGRLELVSGERQAAREDFIAAHAEFQRSRGDGYPLSRQALALEQQAQGG